MTHKIIFTSQECSNSKLLLSRIFWFGVIYIWIFG